ncbi:hypothetical protein ACXR2T_00195 [Leucobacter sp. HY1910]
MAAPALNAAQVEEILARSRAGEGRAALAAAYGVSVYTIDSVRRGRTRGAQDSQARSLSAAQAEQIRQRHTAGETQTALAAEFGTSQQVVSQIVRGVTYK